MGEEYKLDTIVQRSTTNKSNTASPQFKEEILKSTFSKIFEESNSSKQMNLANSLGIETPKLVHFVHLPIDTNNVGNLLNGIINPEWRTLTGSGGAQTGTIGWRIRMMMKL